MLSVRRDEHMKIILEDVEKLMEMANLRGKQVKTDNIDFSFYFSSKAGNSHSIRIKICWNRERMKDNCVDGYMELHGDYKYVNSPGCKIPNNKQIVEAREFFRKYKVLFAAVWEGTLEADIVQLFFMKRIRWPEVLSEFEDISKIAYDKIQLCSNISELEAVVRKTHAFNMND